MSVSPYVILYLIPAATSAVLAFYAWRRASDESRPFALLMAAVAFWSVCHALSVADPTFAGTLFWAQVQYGGIVLVSPFWLLFALAYAGRPEYRSRYIRAGLLLPAIFTLAAVLTNGWHQLWWPTIAPDTSRAFLSLAVSRGLLFWLHAGYSYACVLIGIGLFVYSMLESQLVYRNQARLVLVGALIPFVGNLALLFGGLRLNVVDDPTPFLFGASGLFMGYATRRYRLLDLAPVAQHAVFENMPDGVVVIERRGVIATLNAAAARLLGVDAETWIGRRAAELPGVSPLAGALRDLLEARQGEVTTKVFYSAHAEPRVVEVRRGPLAAGQLLQLRDVTEQVQMEAQLTRRLTELTLLNQIARAANASSQTHGLLETIAGVIIRTIAWDRVMIGVMRPEGSAFDVAINMAAQGEAEAGVTRVTAAEFPLIFDILQTSDTRVLSAGDPLLAGTTTAEAMARYQLQTALVVPLQRQREMLGVLVVGYTQPQAIAAEDLRLYETVGQLIGDAISRARLYEAANEASALKSAFLATISHELRTPLTSIIGYADMLEGGVFGELPDRASEPLEHVRHNGQALLRMINDVLDFSKMEAGHFAVDLYPVDLATVIRGVAGALQPQIRERGLRLELSIAPELPLIHGNSGRLEQVLTNLLSNAIKFTDAGTITIAAEHNDDRVRLSVRDTGIGIAASDMRLLFQPFHQIDNQLTRRYGGTGLGLAISQRLVELMHGTLSLESVPGQGSTFYCDLQVLSIAPLKEVAVSDRMLQ